MSCGSLDDGPIEGLAHLAEHMTLASDPAGLASFIDGRQGEVNAFTGERTTTFYAQFDLDSERGLDVEIGDGLRRFAALFALLLTGLSASADTVQVTVELDGDEVQIIDAVLTPQRSSTRPPSAPRTGDRISAIDERGVVQASVPLVDPRQRSVVASGGGGQAVVLESAVVRIELSWPPGSARVRLDELELEPIDWDA